MLILGIESSCDDTSAALVETNTAPLRCASASSNNKAGETNIVNFKILSEKTASQIEVHKKYGGVVPEIAGRKHAENILPVIEEVLKHSNIQIPIPSESRILDSFAVGTFKHLNIKTFKHKNNTILPDVIAVTSGPGLITGLLVGVEAAKSLSYLWNIPLVSVNHINGHIHSVLLNSNKSEADQIAPPMRGSSPPAGGVRGFTEFPAVCLIVSGGHTELILMKSHNEFELIGKTRDDAVGETFDKIAKLIGFDYPGGAKISLTAEGGNTKAIKFPRPMIKEGYEFSFAGLKTSALYWLRDNCPEARNMKHETLVDFCASIEQAIVDVLITKTMRAAKEFNPKTIILAGGVSANKKLRNTLQEEIKNNLSLPLLGGADTSGASAKRGSALGGADTSGASAKRGLNFQIPNSNYCMDNAAMIAVAGYYSAIKNEYTDWNKIEANPNWRIA